MRRMTRFRQFAFVLTCVLPVAAANASVITMGAGGSYATLADAVAAAVAGDTISIAAGTYTDQVASIDVPLTIMGTGGPVIFTQSASELPHLKGFLITNADTTVENITFQNAAISDDNGANGAGIRYQSGDLTVINSRFIGNQDGILAAPGTPGTGTILIQNSSFIGNGVASGPRSGLEHGIYIGMVASLTVIGSTFQGTLVGHDIKSRARKTTITGNTLDDGVSGTTSYAIDLPNGGLDTVFGNTIDQGPNTGNSSMIAYAAEDPGNTTWPDNALLVSGNLFDNSNQSSIAVHNFSSGVTAVINCNAFDNVDTVADGLASLSGNVIDGPVPACGQSVPEPSGLTLAFTALALLAACRVLRGQPRLVA